MDGGGGETETYEHPPPAYSELYVAVESSEVCLSLNPPNAFCTRDSVARETKLELAFSRERIREDALAPLSRLFSRLV